MISKPTADSPAAEAFQLSIRGADLTVRDSLSSGQDPAHTLVWLHGMQGTMAGEDVGPILFAPTGDDRLRVVRYDARSHGTSSTSGDAHAHTWPELAKDLLGVVDALGLDSFALGGASMGAATAIYAALAAPARIRQLVLAIPPSAWRTREPLRGQYRAAISVVEAGGMAAFADMTRQRPAHPVAEATQGRWLQMHCARLLGMDPEGVQLALEGAILSDLPEPAELTGIAVPTLVLSWPGDPTHPEATAAQLSESIPCATYEPASSLDEVLSWSGRVRDWVLEQGAAHR